MDNGYSITGTGYRYCRDSGSDANSGATTALPKATIAGVTSVATVGTVSVILAGVYREALSFKASSSYIADGVVIIEGVNPSSSTLTNDNNATHNMTGFIVRNYGTITSYNSDIGGIAAVNCIFSNILNIITLLGSNSIIIDSTTTGSSSGVLNFLRYILKNYTANFIGSNCYIRASYVHTDCVITINATALTTFKNNFISNCFRGVVSYSGQGYVVPQAVDLTGSGTGVVAFASRTGTYPAGATDWIHNLFSITPTVCYITNGNFNADPLFNDVANNDFTVSTSSPLIGKISGVLGRGANIGWVRVATTFADLSTWNQNNITNTSGAYTITSGSKGALTSPTLVINSSVARGLSELNLAGTYMFDASVSGGTVDRNENVPIIKSYKKQGSTITNTNPRPCLKMRLTNNAAVANYYKTVGVTSGNDTVTCTDTSNLAVGMEVFGDGIEFGATILSITTNVSVQLSANCFKTVASTTMMTATPSQWDNNGYTGLNAGDWFIVEFNKSPKIDQNGYGNADSAYDVINNGLAMGKYVQFCIELRNDTAQG